MVINGQRIFSQNKGETMINQQRAWLFAEQLQHRMPEIENLQLLTVDGLAMRGSCLRQDEDKLSALSALLYSGAQQLADCLQEESPKGLIVCIGVSAYVIAQLGDELVLGLQVPADLGHPQFLQTVCQLIGEYEQSSPLIH